MSLKAMKPRLEEVIAKLAERVRHLETAGKWQFGMVRNADHFAVGSATGGIAEAITNLGASEGVVYAPPKTYPFNNNYAIPANVHLRFAKGAIFNIANGVTLTINGTVEAGLYQIFFLTGPVPITGTVQFAYGAVPQAYPQWWGATETAGINEALDSLPT